MAEQPIRSYVAVTVDAEPRVFLLKEDAMPRRRQEQGLIFHCWLCAGATGIVGVKFSSWMIKHGGLTPAERSVVSRWNQSEADFEVFFGADRDYDNDDIGGAAALAVSLTDWAATR